MLFSLLLLGQALFPMQLHTRVAHTASGKTVILCTLQGYQTVTVDEEGNLFVENEASQAASSPAVKFSQLLSSAIPLPTYSAPETEEFASTQVDNLQLALPERTELWRFSIRAPPAHLSLITT